MFPSVIKMNNSKGITQSLLYCLSLGFSWHSIVISSVSYQYILQFNETPKHTVLWVSQLGSFVQVLYIWSTLLRSHLGTPCWGSCPFHLSTIALLESQGIRNNLPSPWVLELTLSQHKTTQLERFNSSVLGLLLYIEPQ